MKKLAFIAAAALAGTCLAEGITSANVVGYTSRDLVKYYNWSINPLLSIGTSEENMKLFAFSTNDKFVNSTVRLLSSSGATKKITVEGLGEVKAEFEYWTADDIYGDTGLERATGWYLSADTATFDHCQNDYVLPFATGFIVYGQDTGAGLTYSGQVKNGESGFAMVKYYNWVGNCSAADVYLGDLTMNDKFVNSTIRCLTANGGTKRITVEGLGEVKEEYEFWTADDIYGDTGLTRDTGWYLSADVGTFNYCQNLVKKFAPGEGFVAYGQETGAIIYIPNPLN